MHSGSSLLLALAGGWTEAPTRAHPLSELFPLLRRHVRAAFCHAPPKIGAMKAPASNASEQNAAERQQSHGKAYGVSGAGAADDVGRVERTEERADTPAGVEPSISDGAGVQDAQD